MPMLCETEPTSAPAPTARTAGSRLEAIAQTAVRLAALGPELAALARDLEAQAQKQAGQADRAAATMGLLTEAVTAATGELRGAAAQVGTALGTVARIAEQTKIISLNASIEAARAGTSGLAFGVVAEEVKRLAGDTGATTHTIKSRVGEMHASIGRMGCLVGDRKGEAAEAAATIADVEREVLGMNRSAGAQLESSREVHGLGDAVNTLTETLLREIGAFRFAAHRRAEQALRCLAEELMECPRSRYDVERLLSRWLEAQTPFELAYCTDAAGRQFVDNIRCCGDAVACDKSGYGRDWSDRPWFRQGAAAEDVSSTDLYRSTATGDYCFTVVAPLRTPDGRLRGVLAADVNFRRLLTED